MLAARLHGTHDIVVHDEPPPVAGPGEAIVDIEAVGLCGSDTHWWETGGIGETQLPPGGLVLGHEIVGSIEEDRKRIRVVVDPSRPCGTCPTCTSGSEDLCPSTRFAGFGTTDGGLRERMAWPRRLLVPIPADFDRIESCQLEPLGVALRAVDRAGIEPATRVAVMGTGPIGLLVIRACRARGVEVVLATDRLAHRVEASRASGATEAWLTSDGDGPIGSRDMDVVIECAGTDGAVATALELVRPGGHVVLVGIPRDDRTTFRASLARRKGLTVSLSRRMRASDLSAAVELVSAGRISLDGLVTHVTDLADASSAFSVQAARSGLKVVVRPNAIV